MVSFCRKNKRTKRKERVQWLHRRKRLKRILNNLHNKKSKVQPQGLKIGLNKKLIRKLCRQKIFQVNNKAY